jgi:hypothetical protein
MRSFNKPDKPGKPPPKWHKKKSPKPVENVGMNNAKVTWDLPTTRESGGPLPVEEIAGVDVSMSADLGANWTALGRVEPSELQEMSINDLAPGDWIFRMVVRDTDDRPSTEVDAPFKIEDETAPSGVTNTNVELS